MRPSETSSVAQSGLSSSTWPVRPRTTASLGKAAAADTKWRKSSTGRIESTVVINAGESASRAATSWKLAYDDGVVRTITSRSKSWPWSPSHRRQSSLPSLMMTVTRRMPAARKRSSVCSIRGRPPTGAIGLLDTIAVGSQAGPVSSGDDPAPEHFRRGWSFEDLQEVRQLCHGGGNGPGSASPERRRPGRLRARSR